MGYNQVYYRITSKIERFEENSKSPAIYALVGSFFYVMVGLCVKKLDGIPPTQILYFRCIFSMIINSAVIKVGKHEVYPKDKGMFKLLIMRSIFGGLAHICYYQAISMLNLSDA